MASIVQQVEGTRADPSVLTITEPTSGNLGIVVMMERSGGSASNHVLTGITGWTHTIVSTTEAANPSFRRSFSVFWKVHGASEGTTINADDTTSNNKHCFYVEFTHEAGESTWSLLDSASNDNGTTTDASSIASGTTGSIGGSGDALIFAVMGQRNNIIVTPPVHTWGSIALTSGNAFFDTASTDDFTNYMTFGYNGAYTGTGTVATTASYSSGSNANTGINAAILAFDLQSGGGPTVAKNLLQTNNLGTDTFNGTLQ